MLETYRDFHNRHLDLFGIEFLNQRNTLFIFHKFSACRSNLTIFVWVSQLVRLVLSYWVVGGVARGQISFRQFLVWLSYRAIYWNGRPAFLSLVRVCNCQSLIYVWSELNQSDGIRCRFLPKAGEGWVDGAKPGQRDPVSQLSWLWPGRPGVEVCGYSGPCQPQIGSHISYNQNLTRATSVTNTVPITEKYCRPLSAQNRKCKQYK